MAGYSMGVGGARLNADVWWNCGVWISPAMFRSAVDRQRNVRRNAVHAMLDSGLIRG